MMITFFINLLLYIRHDFNQKTEPLLWPLNKAPLTEQGFIGMAPGYIFPG
jgi:hypothetical protein